MASGLFCLTPANPSSLIMCTSTEELKYQAEWDGAHGQSRRQLLSELSRMVYCLLAQLPGSNRLQDLSHLL